MTDVGIAQREVVFRKVCGQGCARRVDIDTPASYAFICQTQSGGKIVERLFFIPRELTAGGYTIAQLQEIEQTLAYFGFDLLPLEHILH